MSHLTWCHKPRRRPAQSGRRQSKAKRLGPTRESGFRPDHACAHASAGAAGVMMGRLFGVVPLRRRRALMEWRYRRKLACPFSVQIFTIDIKLIGKQTEARLDRCPAPGARGEPLRFHFNTSPHRITIDRPVIVWSRLKSMVLTASPSRSGRPLTSRCFETGNRTVSPGETSPSFDRISQIRSDREALQTRDRICPSPYWQTCNPFLNYQHLCSCFITRIQPKSSG